MGNQLVGVAPAQIQPVEYYLSDVQDFKYDSSLGSTRFFKVARARCRNDSQAVIKVFVIHDLSLPLKTHKDTLLDIKLKLQNECNCLPFNRILITDKAALLFRQFIKHSLYDRISTRPFLNQVEKTWLAFQMLQSLKQCHDKGVCHGDIKLENFLVTAWNWVLLADFASFKLPYLPEDNPADFSYFFDTSRRRVCYIAPERFVSNPILESGAMPGHVLIPGVASLLNTTLIIPSEEMSSKGELKPAMDIFSLGCAIMELFTDGTVPFDYSQLLAYRSGDYNPGKVIQKIDNEHMRDMVAHMIQKDSTARMNADSYLQWQKGKAFPNYFYSFMGSYMASFCQSELNNSDSRINKIYKDFDIILDNLLTDCESKDGLVIIVTLLVSCIRSLQSCNAKLQCLIIIRELSPHLSDELILDRLLPVILVMLRDSFSQVRSSAIHTLNRCVQNCGTVPRSDTNIFPEYILPILSLATQDDAVNVRLSVVENIADLAETALRFLELSHYETINENTAEIADEIERRRKASYVWELKILQEMFQQMVFALLGDHNNMVKRMVLEKAITRMCVFFGRQKVNESIIPYIVTFLNEQLSGQLRAAFFDTIVGIVAFVGIHSSPILKPLLQHGVHDVDEFVAAKALLALTNLTELGLLYKDIEMSMLRETVCLLHHPNRWLRQATVGYIHAITRKMHLVDLHSVLPLITPYLKTQPLTHTLNKEVVTLSMLDDCLPRQIFDCVVKSPQIFQLLTFLQEKQVLKSVYKGDDGELSEDLPDALVIAYKRLCSYGMNEADERKVVALGDFLLKVHKAKTKPEGSSGSTTDAIGVSEHLGIATVMRREVTEVEGIVNLGANFQIPLRFADLSLVEIGVESDSYNEFEAETDRRPHLRRKGAMRSHATDNIESFSSPAAMNEEWQHMFGGASTGSGIEHSVEESKSSEQAPLEQKTVDFTPLHPTGMVGVTYPMIQTISKDVTISMDNSSQMFDQQNENHFYKHDFSDLLSWKAMRRFNHIKNVESCAVESIGSKCVCPDPNRPNTVWKPKGQLIAHLHEHRAAINRIQVVSAEGSLFATCSSDGTVKVWDASKMEGRGITNRSKQTYGKADSAVMCLAACQSQQSLAAADERGKIHVLRVESGSCRMTVLQTKMTDVEEEGNIVDMHCFDSGGQNMLAYATVNGSIIGCDLRTKLKSCWALRSKPSDGLLTSFCIEPRSCWMVAGTSKGRLQCWDLRFSLPVVSNEHPSGARIRRLALHPDKPSWVLAAVQGNNEVSAWDLESGSRCLTLWASQSPPLSLTQVSNHSVHAMLVLTSGKGADRNRQTAVLTGGSDTKLRFWDPCNTASSCVISNGVRDLQSPHITSFRQRLVDGTEIIQEVILKPRSAFGEMQAGGSRDEPMGGGKSEDGYSSWSGSRKNLVGADGMSTTLHGHQDMISDLAICRTSQWLLVSGSRDGVVKIWK